MPFSPNREHGGLTEPAVKLFVRPISVSIDLTFELWNWNISIGRVN